MTAVRDPDSPPSWEDQPVFRELFLAHAPPRLAAALREAGRVLYEDLLEAGLPAAGEASGERWVHDRVRALAGDSASPVGCSRPWPRSPWRRAWTRRRCRWP